MKIFLVLSVFVLGYAQSFAASNTVEVPNDTYKVQIIGAHTSQYYSKRVEVPNCPEIVLEGGSECSTFEIISEPVLILTYQIETHYVDNDPVEGGQTHEMIFSLNELDTKTRDDLLMSGASRRLKIIESIASVQLFDKEVSERVDLTDASCKYPRHEGESDCPIVKSGVLRKVLKRFLAIELN